PNVLINTLMLEAAHRARVARFCFISSGAAYPPTAGRPVREEEMFNGDPHEVYFAAGWMKRYAEVLCQTYAEKIPNPMPTVVVRPSNVYGPYDKFDFAVSHVTAALIPRVVQGPRPPEVWGNRPGHAAPDPPRGRAPQPARGLGQRPGHPRPGLHRRFHRGNADGLRRLSPLSRIGRAHV